MCLSDVRHIIVSPNIKRSLSMFKKFLIIQSVIIILFLNMTSSFVYAGFFLTILKQILCRLRLFPMMIVYLTEKFQQI